jgi:hypothetical protein
MDATKWATVWLGAVVGVLANRDSDYYRYSRVGLVVAVAGNGKYLQLSYLDGAYSGRTVWVFANLYYRLADNANEYSLQRRITELESEVSRHKPLWMRKLGATFVLSHSTLLLVLWFTRMTMAIARRRLLLLSQQVTNSRTFACLYGSRLIWT